MNPGNPVSAAIPTATARGDDRSRSDGRIAKNTASQLAAFGLNAGTKAVAALIVARAMGPGGLGTFSLSWTIAQAASVLCVIGLDYLLIRELARRREPSELERALPLALLLSTLAAALVAGGALRWASRPELTGALLAGAAYVAASGPALVFRAGFHARERMEFDAAANAVEGVTAIAAVSVLMALGGGVAGAVAGLAIGRVACATVGFRFYARLWGRPRLRWDPRSWKRLLRASAPMGVSHVFTALYLRFDIVLLGAFVAAADVGIYSAAAVIVLTVPIIATSYNGSLYPILSRIGDPANAEFQRVFRRSARLQLLLSLPLAAGATVLAEPIIRFLYGDGFGRAASVLAVLVWVFPLRFVNNLLGVSLTATDRQGLRTAAVTVGAVVNFGLNLALIPVWGIWGAVWATLATEAVLSGVLVWALRPLRPPILEPAVRGWISAGLTSGLVLAVPGPLPIRIAAGGVVALGLAAAWAREPTAPVDVEHGPIDPVVTRDDLERGITAVVLTRNEAHNLERCLATLDWVDRVLVVDAESDDGTPELARRLGADVEVHPQRDFASQRNFALGRVRTEWVLWVDADWEIPRLFAEEARFAVRDGRFVAYEFPMVNLFCGRPLRHHAKIRARLHRSDHGRWGGFVHEQLRVDGPVGALKTPVIHHYVEDVAERARKIVHYAQLDAARRIDSGYRFRFRDLVMAPARRTLGNLVFRRGVADGPAGVITWTLRGFETFLSLSLVWASERGSTADLRTAQEVARLPSRPPADRPSATGARPVDCGGGLSHDRPGERSA